MLLNEAEYLDKNLFKASLANLDMKYFFPETLLDYFQRTASTKY